MKLSKQALIALGVTGTGVLSAADLTREQLNQMLEETAKNPVTSKLSPAAMCYRMAAPLERIEYTCPLCKAKTLHAKRETAWRIYRDLEGYRQKMKRIKELGLDAALDETDCCSQCRKDKTTEDINFRILVTVGNRMIRTELEVYDLNKIVAFLERKDIWEGGQGSTHPLKPELPRIRAILGMERGEAKK